MAPKGKQKAIQVVTTDAKDDFSHFELIDTDIPTPGDGEVSARLRLHARLEAAAEPPQPPQAVRICLCAWTPWRHCPVSQPGNGRHAQGIQRITF